MLIRMVDNEEGGDRTRWTGAADSSRLQTSDSSPSPVRPCYDLNGPGPSFGEVADVLRMWADEQTTVGSPSPEPTDGEPAAPFSTRRALESALAPRPTSDPISFEPASHFVFRDLEKEVNAGIDLAMALQQDQLRSEVALTERGGIKLQGAVSRNTPGQGELHLKVCSADSSAAKGARQIEEAEAESFSIDLGLKQSATLPTADSPGSTDASFLMDASFAKHKDAAGLHLVWDPETRSVSSLGIQGSTKTASGVGVESKLLYTHGDGSSAVKLGGLVDTNALDVYSELSWDPAQGGLSSGQIRVGNQLQSGPNAGQDKPESAKSPAGVSSTAAAPEETKGPDWSISLSAARNAALGDPLSLRGSLSSGGFTIAGNAGLSLSDGGLSALGFGANYLSPDGLTSFSLSYDHARSVVDDAETMTDTLSGSAAFPLDQDWAARLTGGLSLENGVVNNASLGAEVGYRLNPGLALQLGGSVFAKTFEDQLLPGFGLSVGLENPIVPILLSYSSWAGNNRFGLQTPVNFAFPDFSPRPQEPREPTDK